MAIYAEAMDLATVSELYWDDIIICHLIMDENERKNRLLLSQASGKTLRYKKKFHTYIPEAFP